MLKKIVTSLLSTAMAATAVLSPLGLSDIMEIQNAIAQENAAVSETAEEAAVPQKLLFCTTYTTRVGETGRFYTNDYVHYESVSCDTEGIISIEDGYYTALKTGSTTVRFTMSDGSEEQAFVLVNEPVVTTPVNPDIDNVEEEDSFNVCCGQQVTVPVYGATDSEISGINIWDDDLLQYDHVDYSLEMPNIVLYPQKRGSTVLDVYYYDNEGNWKDSSYIFHIIEDAPCTTKPVVDDTMCECWVCGNTVPKSECVSSAALMYICPECAARGIYGGTTTTTLPRLSTTTTTTTTTTTIKTSIMTSIVTYTSPINNDSAIDEVKEIDEDHINLLWWGKYNLANEAKADADTWLSDISAGDRIKIDFNWRYCSSGKEITSISSVEKITDDYTEVGGLLTVKENGFSIEETGTNNVYEYAIAAPYSNADALEKQAELKDGYVAVLRFTWEEHDGVKYVKNFYYTAYYQLETNEYCDNCGAVIREGHGGYTPLGMHLCDNCLGTGIGGTLPAGSTCTSTTTTQLVTSTTIVTGGRLTTDISGEIVSNSNGCMKFANGVIIDYNDLEVAPQKPEMDLSQYKPGDSLGVKIVYIAYTRPFNVVSILEIYDIEKKDISEITGDANCDYRVNMGDAVLILQASANPDTYGIGKPDGISEQGWKNADVSGGGDGVTAGDAQAIQSYALGLISKLR